jgi:hypothetical protein
MANIYKVYIDDPAAGNVAVWTMEAANPVSAISKVIRRVSYGKSAKVELFEVSAELEVRNMTYAEYKSRRTMLTPDTATPAEAGESS